MGGWERKWGRGWGGRLRIQMSGTKGGMSGTKAKTNIRNQISSATQEISPSRRDPRHLVSETRCLEQKALLNKRPKMPFTDALHRRGGETRCLDYEALFNKRPKSRDALQQPGKCGQGQRGRAGQIARRRSFARRRRPPAPSSFPLEPPLRRQPPASAAAYGSDHRKALGPREHAGLRSGVLSPCAARRPFPGKFPRRPRSHGGTWSCGPGTRPSR